MTEHNQLIIELFRRAISRAVEAENEACQYERGRIEDEWRERLGRAEADYERANKELCKIRGLMLRLMDEIWEDLSDNNDDDILLSNQRPMWQACKDACGWSVDGYQILKGAEVD